MEDKLLDQSYRKQVINEIKADENVQRKIVSYKKHNMQNDNFHQYVVEHLESRLDYETVKELNIFSNVNLQRRISKAESTIYNKEPMREFFIADNEFQDIKFVYDAANINTVLRNANVAYKYLEQCLIQVYPFKGELKARVLLPHHYDVIPDPHNPEEALIYIISNFNNTDRDRIRRDNDRTGFSQGDTYRDSINQAIADYDDSELAKERYTVWGKKYNFVMDGKGNILDKQTDELLTNIEENDVNIISPLIECGVLPFIDISKPKDFEYWVRSGNILYDTTILFNVCLTNEFKVVTMQGHAQAFLKGSAEHMPENIRIGADKVIFIPIDENNPVNAEFGFANTGADLAGIREFRASLLNDFLQSRGLDTSIMGSPQASVSSSGIERMLQMIEKFEASQEDFSIFRNAEKKLIYIFACWINSLKGATDSNGNTILKDEYDFSINSPEEVSVSVEYSKPEMIKTEREMIEIAQLEIEAGLSSRVHAIMEIKGLTEDQAIEYIKKVDEFQGLVLNEIKP